MSSSTKPDPARERLARLMDTRRREIGRRRGKRYSWDEVAQAAGLHRETLRLIRNGTGALTDTSKDGIEEALHWNPGSIDRIMNDDAPIPRESSAPEGPAGELGRREEDRLDRAWRRYRDDPGPRGTVLRGLVDTWDREDEQGRDAEAG
jgi:hypothetical protein